MPDSAGRLATGRADGKSRAFFGENAASSGADRAGNGGSAAGCVGLAPANILELETGTTRGMSPLPLRKLPR